MKTLCKNCGHGNDLGHLFCTKCSAKLDLVNVNDEIESSVKSESRHTFLYMVLALIVLAMIVLAALMLWPSKKPVSERVPGGRRDIVEAAVSRLEMVAERGVAPYTTPMLTEEDLNTWIAGMSSKFGVKSLNVQLKPGAYKLRVVDTVGPWSLFGGNVSIPAITYSYDISGAGAAGGFTVTGSRVGHLKMFGPMTRKVSGHLEKAFKDRKREQLLSLIHI